MGYYEFPSWRWGSLATFHQVISVNMGRFVQKSSL